MKTLIFPDKSAASLSAAEKIKAQLDIKPASLLAFSAGRSMDVLFSLLGEMCARGEISFKEAKILSVTEFEGDLGDKSCENMLRSALLDRLDVKEENCIFINAGTLPRYDDIIASLGGIDLIVLGLGDNAHIGYNEPATQYDTLSHRQKLTEPTRRQLSWLFGESENAPQYAYTMGIKTIASARDIFVLAFGDEKADGVFNMLYARDDSIIPAAFLQLPMNVCVYLDKLSAAKLD